MPIDILKYSNLVKQELYKGEKNPFDIILAWIIGWAYAEQNELLARQIIRQLKVELPNQFEQAFNQALQLLTDPNFKQRAVKAFEIAINRYKVREAIKTIAFEGPASRVLAGLRELQQNLPHVSVFNRLIQDIEAIIQYKGEEPQTPVVTQQQAAQQTASTHQPASYQQTQIQQTPQQYQAPIQTTQQYSSSQRIQPLQPSGPSTFEQNIDRRLGTLEDRFEILEDIAASITELSGRIESMEEEFQGLINVLKKNIDELREFLYDFRSELVDAVKQTIREVSIGSRSGISLDKSVLDSLKNAMEFLGIKISEEVLGKLKHEEKKIEVKPPHKGPRPPPTPPPEVPIELAPVKTDVSEATVSQLPPPPQIPTTADKKVSVIPELPPPPSIPVVSMETNQQVHQQQAVAERQMVSGREIYITAYGGLRKLTAILKDYRVGTFRWKFEVSTEFGEYTILIQGAEKRLPKRIQEEIINKSEGLLIVEDIMQSQVLNLIKFAKLIKNLKFIAWGGVFIPDQVKELGVPVINGSGETFEDLVNLIREVINRVYKQ